MAFIKGVDRNQRLMFPEYVETLDFKEMGFTKVTEIRPGAPGYHPSALMKLYLYGYLNGVKPSKDFLFKPFFFLRLYVISSMVGSSFSGRDSFSASLKIDN